jgi:hypothetical protein
MCLCCPDTHVFEAADALLGDGVDANARLSTLACLAHELAHAERFQLGYRRSTGLPDVLLDEAETSLRASFTSILSPKDREDLVEDARDPVDPVACPASARRRE